MKEKKRAIEPVWCGVTSIHHTKASNNNYWPREIKGAKYLGQIAVLLAVEQKRKLEVEK